MLNLILNNVIYATVPSFAASENVFKDIQNCLQGKVEDYYLLQNGRIFREGDVLCGNTINVVPRLRGGKGGFGSMLRAIGAQIEKTTNREACRDLSGRRLRDINEEKRLKKWIAEQADREREAAEKKKKKLEKLSYEPKHEFADAQYDKVRAEMVEKVHSAVEEGLKASCSADIDEPSTSKGVKRKTEEKEKKKGLLWIDADEFGSDVSDSEEEEEADEGQKEPKKLKVA